MGTPRGSYRWPRETVRSRPRPGTGQTRARYPDEEGKIDRDGVGIAYEVYGRGGPTILLMPTWTMSHSRIWKAQIPYLAHHTRVVTFDPRGNGRSDRPTEIASHTEAEHAADALAVLDATDTDRAIVVCLSKATHRTLLLAGDHPDRVAGIVAISPQPPVSRRLAVMFAIVRATFERRLPRVLSRTWQTKLNAHYMQTDYRDFVESFVRAVCNDPHSTKHIEDGVGFGLETDAHTLQATILCDDGLLTRRQARQLAGRVQCPVLVLNGTHDIVTPPSNAKALARLTGGRLELISGGHVPNARKPVPVDLAIREFAEPGFDRAAVPTLTPGAGKRVLYLSSPVGLGHARRDLAVAQQLRERMPSVAIDWLAQEPVTSVLQRDGEQVHPASTRLANEMAHIDAESHEHDLHVFQAFRRADELLVNNYMVLRDVVHEQRYDLIVGDESWELDYFLHEHPSEKTAPFAWFTDFVGWLPMPSGGEHERYLAADYNAQMVDHIARHPEVRDLALFVGDRDDVVAESLGPGLPTIRDWTADHFDFTGYITGFDPTTLTDREALRAELGYHPDEQVCIATVGGSGVGAPLLRRIIDAYPHAKRRLPALRMIVVAGPRIDPASLPTHDGLEIVGYVHGLYRHLAACDIAIVQGGLTTTMELVANHKPFLYFPLKNHFEQNFHVTHRLQRHRAGRRMDIDTADTETIAAALADELTRDLDYRPVDPNGAARAAARLAELL